MLMFTSTWSNRAKHANQFNIDWVTEFIYGSPDTDNNKNPTDNMLFKDNMLIWTWTEKEVQHKN